VESKVSATGFFCVSGEPEIEELLQVPRRARRAVRTKPEPNAVEMEMEFADALAAYKYDPLGSMPARKNHYPAVGVDLNKN